MEHVEFTFTTEDSNCRIFPWQHETFDTFICFQAVLEATRGHSAFVCNLVQLLPVVYGYAVLQVIFILFPFSSHFQDCIFYHSIWQTDETIGSKIPNESLYFYNLTQSIDVPLLQLHYWSSHKDILLCWIYPVHPKPPLARFVLWKDWTLEQH